MATVEDRNREQVEDREIDVHEDREPEDEPDAAARYRDEIIDDADGTADMRKIDVRTRIDQRPEDAKGSADVLGNLAEGRRVNVGQARLQDQSEVILVGLLRYGDSQRLGTSSAANVDGYRFSQRRAQRIVHLQASHRRRSVDRDNL